MTDYKELIDTLRDLTRGFVRVTKGSVLWEAADAIEAMTAERDALAKRIVELEAEAALEGGKDG